LATDDLGLDAVNFVHVAGPPQRAGRPPPSALRSAR
jgi:hypothetical protein